MVADKIQNFGGMVPAVDERLIPSNIASYIENAWIYSGKLCGMNEPTLAYTCTSSAVSKVFRLPNSFTDNILDSTWVEFENSDTDIVRAPIVGDTFSRYYFASSSASPRYNTTARMQAGQPSYLLGIPTPTIAPSVAVAGGVSTVVVVRSYVWTLVSAYGEEGPPSPPFVRTGKVDDTWTVTLPTVGALDTADRNLSKRRIYRTITSSAGVATYFLVTELNDLTTLTYADTLPDSTVSNNAQLQSTTWSAPPSDLEGMIAMPNGMIAGWRDNELWFAEPYRPHAWPALYTLAVEYPIVGLGVINQTLVVCTQGFPTAATGINPASISLSKLSTYEPCLSRGSIVSAPEGVYYASQNGLVLVGGGKVENITRAMITKDRWNELVPVSTLRAARVGTAYYAFGARRAGCFSSSAFNTSVFSQDDYSGAYRGTMIDVQNERVAFNALASLGPTANVMNDPWSGEVFVIRDGKVLWLNVGDANPTHEVFLWRSKKFQLGSRKNLGAMRVWFDIPSTAPALNPVRNTSLTQEVTADRYGLVRIYAEDRHVSTWELRVSGELIRPPSGFKCEYWQFEIEARVNISTVQIADTVEGLKGV